MFKFGDIVQHKISKEKGIVCGTYDKCANPEHVKQLSCLHGLGQHCVPRAQIDYYDIDLGFNITVERVVGETLEKADD